MRSIQGVNPMQSDFEIGRVVAVDTAQVTVQLKEDLQALTRITYEGVQEVGRINSYVAIPIGARRLIAIVTRVVLSEDAELSADRTMVTLPSARRLLKATLIGTLDAGSFTQGVSLFPVLDSPVFLLSDDDLGTLFRRKSDSSGKVTDPEDPGFCIEIGESVIFEGFPIDVNPDAAFGKHLAILGSTGSGKSCTIAALIQAIVSRPEIKRTNFVILDTNGEYENAFGSQGGGGSKRVLTIPSQSANANRLTIPFWFLNAEDFARLFQASQGVQRPVLLDALRLARNAHRPKGAASALRDLLLRELNRIWSQAAGTEKVSKAVCNLLEGLVHAIEGPEQEEAWTILTAGLPELSMESLKGSLRRAYKAALPHLGRIRDSKDTYGQVLPADAQKEIQEAITPIIAALSSPAMQDIQLGGGVSADSPAYFDKWRFRSQYIDQVIRREDMGAGRAREYMSTMMLRMDRLLEDKRFEFLLGSTSGHFPEAANALATFLRDVLGLRSAENPKDVLSGEDDVPPGSLPFYDRQRAGSTGHNVVVVDLSLLAAEVLDSVTALIGRLVLEFLQRLGELEGGTRRGSLPVVLVLEEAQNYIRDTTNGGEPSISRLVFERIAREGRKFGLGLVVASQRPSELSKTVLSQCSSFIVHRLQNPEDLRYFKDIVPGAYGPLLEQLPSLAPQTALVLGDCVRAPALIRVREARPEPRGQNPRFYSHWVASQEPDIPVEAVAGSWEEQAPRQRENAPSVGE